VGKKLTIPGLADHEIEHGEITVSIISAVRCEHNLLTLEADACGILILTNYKLILKPTGCRRADDPRENPKDYKVLQ
jgi:hypothetical protein